MARVTKKPQARQDISNIWMHIATKGNGEAAAQAMIEKFDAAFKLLSQTPGAGAARSYLPPDLRGFTVPPYIIVYRISGSRVSILRVVHGAQDVGRIFQSGT